MAASLHADRREGQGARPRHYPREQDEGRGGRDRTDLRGPVWTPHGRPSVARLREVRRTNPGDAVKIPKSHPRYTSLMLREKLVKGWREGIVVPEGLIAHGRGEAFDYVLGETTSAPALVAERAAAAFLLRARRPVISVNGNVAALAARQVVRFAKTVSAGIEVNLFHRTDTRMRRIVRTLRAAGATHVLGLHPNARIPRLESRRALSSREGIFGADVVVVPLEDGDRTEALVRMGKTVISVDLNPLSRTSQRATIPVVDELTRALPNMERFARDLRSDPDEIGRLMKSYRKAENVKALFACLDWRVRGLREGLKLVRGTPRRPRRVRHGEGKGAGAQSACVVSS